MSRPEQGSTVYDKKLPPQGTSRLPDICKNKSFTITYCVSIAYMRGEGFDSKIKTVVTYIVKARATRLTIQML